MNIFQSFKNNTKHLVKCPYDYVYVHQKFLKNFKDERLNNKYFCITIMDDNSQQ